MKKNLTVFFVLCALGLHAQNLSGFWVGTVMQNGRPNVFSYQLDLQQEGTTLTGKAISITQDGTASAEFSIAGTWEGGGKLVLQELAQVTPKGGGWCLKYASLRLGTTGDGIWVLQGGWMSDNCSPGTMRLVKEADSNQLDVGADTFVPEGIWTGELSQTDRSYEFYYELELKEGGKGFAKIMSEENGGFARQLLNWKLNENRDSLIIEEQGVIEKTDPNWRWCIKKLKLRLDEDVNRFGFHGVWEGRMDATETQKAGACAPGKVYLEKPILDKDVKASIRSLQTQTALSNQGRKLKLQRTIEVKSPELTISVWDNGTEDGDVITLFFNGQQLAKQHRISKNKSNYRVKLSGDENFLILQADDLGSIKPNTVAVSINDGLREQIIVMSADFEENGAVLIRKIQQ